MFGINWQVWAWVAAAFLVVAGYAGFATWQLNKTNVALGIERANVAGRDLIIKGLQDAQLDSNAIASLAANACRSAIQVQVRHQNEGQQIRSAPDGASRAYDRLMCQRPEAAGHPKCAAAG